MPRLCTLAHFSDLHLSNPEPVRATELLDKRVLGYLSWRRRRKRVHDRAILDAAVADARDCAAELLVISGDLTNLGFPRECRQARDWLAEAGTPPSIMVVPGNHDAYVHQPSATTTDLWMPWYGETGVRDEGPFPFLRELGDVALIGVNTARPSPPLLATGRVGRAQLGELEQLLCETGARGLCRVLVMHHPPGPRAVTWRKRLVDAAALRTILARTGVEAVLHGHAHRHCREDIRLGERVVPAFGVPATAATDGRPGRQAAYNLVDVHRAEGGYELTVRRRRFLADRGFTDDGLSQYAV